MNHRENSSGALSLESMQHEIDMLKRRNRQILWLCVCLSGFAAFSAIRPMAGPGRSLVWANDGEKKANKGDAIFEKLRCRSLEIVNLNDERRLTISPGGTIDIFDENGRERISCGLYRAGSSPSEASSKFILSNAAGKTQMRLGEQFGSPSISLGDKEGNTRMKLSWHTATDSQIHMFDKERNVAWEAPPK